MPGPRGSGLQRAITRVRERGSPAQLCVVARGRIVLNEAFDCRPDSLFFLFSASKPLVALLVHLLAERGQLALDDRVAAHWPEFAQGGKQDITIRQVLQHRSGLPVVRGFALDALMMTDWAASVRALEVATPSFPPGSVPAYHVLSYGFILGELVQRVTGAPVRDVLQAELLGPLGLRDSYLGLPAGQWHRHVQISGRGPAELATQLMINRPAVRQAVIPAASVSATAYDLARLYQALLAGGELDGVRVLRPETIRQATSPSSDGEVDRYLKLPVRWSEGFQLGGERAGRTRLGGGPGPMGALASRTTFGHNGSYVCLGWADPERQVAVAYLTACLVSRSAGARHMAAVSDAILSEFS
ncbi:MAG TPA: serine hydrolase domain-containing protein [Streptosporangiaceae bacterium]|nr:serine hydrolase domain-containing protein [Streptosporangiaceae bacterium]